MWALVSKFLPYRDILYGVIAAAAVAFWFYHNHVEQAKGAARVQAAVTLATARAQQAAQARIAALTRENAATQRQVESTYEKALVVATHQRAADVRRLRQYEIYRQTHRMLGGAASPSAQAHGGPEGFSGLASVSISLANALREDDAALAECWADRAALTGK